MSNFDGAEEDIGMVGSRSSPEKQDALNQRNLGFINKQVSGVKITTETSSMDSTSRPSSSNQKKSDEINQDKLESAKAEMGEVREENERLKMILARTVKDYQSLQMQFYDIVNQEQPEKKLSENVSTDDQEIIEEPELVCLSLGTASSASRKEEKGGDSGKCKVDEEQVMLNRQGLSLGFDSSFEEYSESGKMKESHGNGVEEVVVKGGDEEVGEGWPQSKILKTARSGEDEISLQSHAKKARVSVRARCEAPTMNDGCQWRKYGQKISKGNPCPRAYYRCTVAPGCPVRKQVQRCAEDMSILITTYEGSHNHPLPVSATAMASTTSAAASMLTAGSSTSTRDASPSTTSLNFNNHLSHETTTTSRSSKMFYLSNQSISSSPYSTITLDLTAPQNLPSSFNKFSRFPSKSFNFSSSQPNNLQTSWGNIGSGYLSYGAQTKPFLNAFEAQTFNRNQVESLGFGSLVQPHESFYRLPPPAAPPQHGLTETIAAATKAITADPSFQSALAAAISSIVGENSGRNLKRGEHVQAIINTPGAASADGNGCSPNYLNITSSTSNPPQQGNFTVLTPPLPFSPSKSTSASPVETREHIK